MFLQTLSASLNLSRKSSIIGVRDVRINKTQAKTYSLLFYFCEAIIFKATPREKTNEGC